MRKKKIVKKWTEAEIKQLINLSKTYSSAEIAEILDRGTSSVRNKLSILGIKPIQKQTGGYGTFEDMYKKYEAIKKDLLERKYSYRELQEKHGYSKPWMYQIIFFRIDWSDNEGIPITPIRKRRGKKEV